MKWALSEMCQAMKGEAPENILEEAVVTGVSTDTRTIQSGDLFIALRGENHDGHDHIAKAFEKGAAAAVVSRPVLGKNILRVADTLKALGDLAQAWRRRFPIPIVAVTGSNGKTTTKDMTASILATRFKVLKTEGNFNNLIGLPLTLFRLNEEDPVEIAVLEMGMNHPGEIDRLAEIADPEVGVITNVARAHLEGLGGLRQVADAKGELLSRLKEGGTAILNKDDASFAKLRKKVRGPLVTFGRHSEAALRPVNVRSEGLKGSRFDAVFSKKYEGPSRGRKIPMRLSVTGLHNVPNALAALAVADHFNVPPESAKKALAAFQTSGKRMEHLKLRRGSSRIDVINDCYNANPDSMKAALAFLKEAGRGRRKVAVLGEMLELGKKSAALHREIGAAGAEAGISLLMAVGPHASDMARAASKKRKLQSAAFEASDEASTAVPGLLRSGDLVLIKGSRGIKMEKITDSIRAAWGGAS